MNAPTCRHTTVAAIDAADVRPFLAFVESVAAGLLDSDERDLLALRNRHGRDLRGVRDRARALLEGSR